MDSIIAPCRAAALLVLAVLLPGCGMDRSDARSLAMAGQAASEAVEQQTEATRAAVEQLPTTIALNSILACGAVARPDLRTACLEGAPATAMPPAFAAEHAKLLDVLTKRVAAMQDLADAYWAFARLAEYDSGQATADAVGRAFASVNAFSLALAAIGPQGAAVALISPTITGVVADAGSLLSQARQSRLLLAASRDLHAATDALIRLVAAERDMAAMRSLMAELDEERTRLETGALRAGLLPPLAVLTPFYADATGNPALARQLTPRNADLAEASARYLLSANARQRQRHLDASYTQMLATLKALSKEHRKLEAHQSLDVAAVYEDARRLARLVAAVK